MGAKINGNDPARDDLMLNRIPAGKQAAARCAQECIWRMIFLAKQGLVTTRGKIFYQWQVHHENHTYIQKGRIRK